MLLQALFDYFFNLFNGLYFPTQDETIENMASVLISTGGYNNFIVSLPEYFALICSIVALIIILVLCCLFIYKIIKLVGGLIR